MRRRVMMNEEARPALTPGYNKLNYIESTGTQWINSLTVPTENQIFEICFSLSQLYKNQVLFGSRSSGTYNTSTDQIYLNISVQNEMYLFSGKEKKSLENSVEKKIIYTKTITPKEFENSYDGKSTQPLFLFSLNNIGKPAAYAYMKLYGFKIYDNKKIIRDFIACQRAADGAIGLFDTVTQQFFGNAGTGEFIGG